jgi:Rad3-related DNA helicase
MSGCAYYDAIRRAQESDLVVTSYAFYLNRRLSGFDLGHFDLLVCDEAHLALDWLTNVLSFDIPEAKVYTWTKLVLPPVDAVHAWAPALRSELLNAYSDAESSNDWKTAREIATLGKAVRRFIDSRHSPWTIERVKSHTVSGLKLQPVWPGEHSSWLLFNRADKVVLSSATIYLPDAALLGLSDCQEHSLPSTFEASRRQIVFLTKGPAVRVDRHTSPAEMRIITDRMHAFINNTNCKGIVQCPSYKLARQIIDSSRDASRYLLATPRDNKLAKFASPGNWVLVSPSIQEGIDFPYDAARFVLFPKVPFAYFGDELLKARSKSNRSYADSLARRSFVQMSMRAMRAADDYCLIVLFDDHFEWWLSKSKFEDWFAESFRESQTIPTLDKELF